MIPQDISLLAHTHQLGTHQETFAPNKRWRLILPALLMLVLFGTIGVAMLLQANSTDPRRDMSTTTMVTIGLALIVPWLALFIWALAVSPLVSAKARQRQVYVFENGYIHVTRKGPEAYRWDAVQTVFQAIVRTSSNGIPTGTNFFYSLIFTDGRKAKLTTMSAANMARLGQVLMSAICSVQVPKALNYLKTGQPIAFGDFSISNEGIATARKGQIPWTEISGIQLNNGYVCLSRTGKWLAFSSKAAAKIPNLYTFLQVADHLIAASRPAGASAVH